MRQRSQVSARAHRSARRNHRMNPAIQQRKEQLHQLQPHAAEPLRQHIRAQQQHRPHFGLGQRLAQPARMAPHQIPLQRPHLARFNPHIRQLPKPGVHAIRRLAPREQTINHRPRFANARRRRRIQRHGAPTQSNLRNFIKRKRLTREQQRRRHHEEQGTAFSVQRTAAQVTSRYQPATRRYYHKSQMKEKTLSS